MNDVPGDQPERPQLHRREEGGMNTVEYAVGTVAACGFAALLFLCQQWYGELMRSLLQMGLREAAWWPPIGW